jgi:RNA polymerase sigma-70 factor (ECF subfamily)
LQRCDWQTIVTDYGPLVWRTAYRLLSDHSDAADCFQETFLAAFEISTRQHVRNVPALLTRLATMRAIDRLRQRSRRQRREAELDEWRASPQGPADPLGRLQNAELGKQLAQALGQLPPREANVFCLRYLNDMSYREIARQLNVKAATAGVLLHRARTKLRSVLTPAHREKDEVLS